jgi:beta-mannosidase
MDVQTLDTWFICPCTEEEGADLPPADDPAWLPIAVPGHWQQHPDLTTHVGKAIYRTSFPTPSADSPWGAQTRWWLRLNGQFYWSRPSLNGVDLGQHEGYFEPYECDITSTLRPTASNTPNELRVEVECPDEGNKMRKRMLTGVFSHWDCLDKRANPGGIWQPVELHKSGPIRLKQVRCHTEAIHESFAQLHTIVDMDIAANTGDAEHSLDGKRVLFRWTIAPRTFDSPPHVVEQRHRVQAGDETGQETGCQAIHQTVHGLMKLPNPRLWWTHDLGTPDLYTVTLELFIDDTLSDSHRFTFGVRQFEMRDWIPYLNGKRFLIKGNNYAPGDMRIATMAREHYDYDMKLARECHMNLLRVHAHVEHPAFYEAANEAGILLWQDMPLQWLYRSKILPEVRRQVRAMVHVLYNHPSIVIWCMHNEPMFIADTADETFFTRFKTYKTSFGFSWDRDVMDSQLKRVARREDRSRLVVRSSGEFHIPLLREGTDTHTYFGWYRSYGTLQDGELFFRWFPKNMRFITEFGAQSFPNVESCKRFLPAEVSQIDPGHLAEMHGFQPEIMARWIPWQNARTLEELVEMTQTYQSHVHRYYIDRLRYHKYRPTGGIVPFMFRDSYPAISWSVIDYWRVPKQSYHAMRMAFSPQYGFALIEPRTYHVADLITIPLYVINDAQTATETLTLAAVLRNPDGQQLAEVEQTTTLPADSPPEQVDELRLSPEQPGRYTLTLTLSGGLEPIEHTYNIDVNE